MRKIVKISDHAILFSNINIPRIIKMTCLAYDQVFSGEDP